MKQGRFITMEGVDGSGKTTQLQLTARFLLDRGYDVVTTREPGGTKMAERIRSLVLDADAAINARTEVMLYLAARAEHVETVIKPALAAGKLVLCDRFADSTMVYQGFVRGIEIGSTSITATTVDGGFISSCSLVVEEIPAPPPVVYDGQIIFVHGNSWVMAVSDEEEISVHISGNLPRGVMFTTSSSYGSGVVEYQTLDTGNGTGEARVKVMAVRPGNAELIATSRDNPSISASCFIEVNGW